MSLFPGTIQLCIYRKYGTEVSQNQLTTSKLYYLQIFLTIFIPLIEIVRVILAATVFDPSAVYGYMVRLLVKKVKVSNSTLFLNY